MTEQRRKQKQTCALKPLLHQNHSMDATYISSQRSSYCSHGNGLHRYISVLIGPPVKKKGWQFTALNLILNYNESNIVSTRAALKGSLLGLFSGNNWMFFLFSSEGQCKNITHSISIMMRHEFCYKKCVFIKLPMLSSVVRCAAFEIRDEWQWQSGILRWHNFMPFKMIPILWSRQTSQIFNITELTDMIRRLHSKWLLLLIKSEMIKSHSDFLPFRSNTHAWADSYCFSQHLWE